MNYIPQTINTPISLLIWCRIPAPSLITPSPHPTITLPRMRIFQTGFKRLSILSKFWKKHIWQGGKGAGNLVCVIMTQCVRKSIYDSPLNYLYIIKREERGKVRLSFRNRLTILVTFLSFSLICSEKLNFSSSNRPRCFWVGFLFIGRLLKKTTGWFWYFSHEKK